ncbi:unnamed protein product [Amoebophrya sp. A120]|nr:unnamed protein product [Amoebophrya sp. A120]|eukprot:GSA120T00012081001.1
MMTGASGFNLFRLSRATRFVAASGLLLAASPRFVTADAGDAEAAGSAEYDAVGKPKEEGVRFLEDKGKESGVITLPSGLMYKVLKKGEGTMHPKVDTPCSCHYKGTLINGDKFDSSYDRGQPTTFAPNQVIRGWTEAMQLMVEGDKWEMYIPSDLAYGAGGSPPKIPGDSTLIFQMEIMAINGEGTPANRCDAQTLEGCDERQTKYIEKQKAKTPEEVQSELDRAGKMYADNMQSKNLTRKARQWLEVRLAILTQLVKGSKKEKEEL